mmetsp:Transcript_33356/g.78675  ORF Transcript_33356/g.78675 Transcript_33356/m.78675 type:complete len:253 (-) Transcript_33356:194-952(-)
MGSGAGWVVGVLGARCSRASAHSALHASWREKPAHASVSIARRARARRRGCWWSWPALMSEMRARAQREGAMACAGRAPASSNPRLLSPTTSDRAHHAEHAAGVEEEEEEEERRARPHRAMVSSGVLRRGATRAPRRLRAASSARGTAWLKRPSAQRVLLSSWGEKRAAVGGAAARIARSSVGSSRALSRASAQREFESCCGLKAAATSRARRVRATTTGAVPDTSPILASAHSVLDTSCGEKRGALRSTSK